MSKYRIHIIFNSARSGETLTGDDRIFIELSRRWASLGHEIIIYTTEEHYKMFQRQELNEASYVFWPRSPFTNNLLGMASFYLRGTLEGLKYALVQIKSVPDYQNDIVCSEMDAWSSILPGRVMSWRLKAPWIVGFWLFAPKPWAADPVFPRHRALFYYLSQLPILWLVKRFADIVFVTNDLDRYPFQNNRLPLERVIAVKGGVDIKLTDSVPAPLAKEFDAVFIGRIHWQKGVLELIDIWQRVCHQKPNARLAMIGNGELEGAVTQKIKSLGLEENIKQFGFMDGPEKIKIFKASRVVVHPARHESGGQAAAEAMACGLPGVSFDLPALKVYYPRGMLKVLPYNLDEFARLIQNLLDDQELYAHMSREAREYALEWDWNLKAERILELMLSVSSNFHFRASGPVTPVVTSAHPIHPTRDDL